jgi:scyllo-inositol 2-dehydrogenase (NADP+)
MRVIVVGLGVQGQKRRRVAGDDFVAGVDPVHPEADYRRLADVPPATYDAALVCTPDEPKVDLLRELVDRGKHVLVEKPLWAGSEAEIADLEERARKARVHCYSAYNHRFEPHLVRMRDLLASGRLGRVYHCRMFYGNGTARLVRDSWRDRGAGVLPDLGSHLVDIAQFWFGAGVDELRVVSARCHENQSPDHVVVQSEGASPTIALEMTLLMWRNHFTCDILAEKGSAHIESLCKWGPSTFTVRERVLPSGRPSEETTTLVQEDPTWALEYAHFKAACGEGRASDLSADVRRYRLLRRLCEQALRMAA